MQDFLGFQPGKKALWTTSRGYNKEDEDGLGCSSEIQKHHITSPRYLPSCLFALSIFIKVNLHMR
ncbi:hypothetical protein LDENG_00266380 [Lucifuga dentata]|nr:hypothetical protein LDENG_00266380 [Lucifuga dentata]